jgi:cell division protein FtsB
LYFGSRFGTFAAITMLPPAQTSLREFSTRPAILRRQPRRFWPHAMLFAASVLLVNGLFGERGLMESSRARRTYRAAARDLASLKRENAALRDQIRRLRNDPAAIESMARSELGLARAGEIMVTVRDVR